MEKQFSEMFNLMNVNIKSGINSIVQLNWKLKRVTKRTRKNLKSTSSDHSTAESKRDKKKPQCISANDKVKLNDDIIVG